MTILENNLNTGKSKGIITVSIIILLIYLFCIICYSFILLKGSILSNEFKEHNIIIPSHLFMEFSIILSIIGIFSIILILTKKYIGVFLYFICVIVNIILNIVYKGFSASILTTLVLPIIMTFFLLNNKKYFT